MNGHDYFDDIPLIFEEGGSFYNCIQHSKEYWY